jgi:tetraacyldisaccharide 4'-kinase
MQRVIYFLYGWLLRLAAPVVVVYLLSRAWRSADYRASLSQRLGWLPPVRKGGLWLHAVSVGEVLSAAGLLREWQKRRPASPVTVSVGTIAGRRLAEEKLRGLATAVVYAPLDYGWVVRRFLKALRPRAVVVMETEIWPNLWRESSRAGARLVVVNGRISDKAFPRYWRWRWLFRHVLGLPDAILAQTEVSAERYRALGAPPERVWVAGNLKYDFQPGAPAPAVAEWIARLAPPAVWVAASTMPPAAPGDPDEDEVVADVFEELAQRHPRLLLVLAPRRPERFTTAAELLKRRGIRFVKRTELGVDSKLELPGCLLLDSIGELSALFALAQVVFMGGTLVDRGGHNVLEPAYFGKPVVSGPNLQNFPEIAADFRRAGALVEVTDAAGLRDALDGLLSTPARAAAVGERGREVARQRTGATERVLEQVTRWYDCGIPGLVAGWWERVLLLPLTAVWRGGMAIDRVWKQWRRERLPRPVVSIGGIALGGVGKTPFTIALARLLRQTGRSVAILTRGYGRRDARQVVVALPGGAAPVAATGDEAQLLIRAGAGAVAVAANRYRAAQQLLARVEADVFLLDDGFQHWRLERNVDIVVVDAIDPWAGGAVLPLGRLREPPAALRRASAIVLSRVADGDNTEELERAIRRENPVAPIFRGRMRELGWVNYATGVREPPPKRVAAFCGLGNPESFWRSLAVHNLEVVCRRAFADHHRYRVAELEQLAAGVDGLVTTEKDVMNLPEGWRGAVWWLEVEFNIENQECFISWLDGQLTLL